MDRVVTGKTFYFVTWPTVAGLQTGRIPYTKQSRTSWERWLGRILDWFLKTLLPPIAKDITSERPQTKEEAILKVQ